MLQVAQNCCGSVFVKRMTLVRHFVAGTWYYQIGSYQFALQCVNMTRCNLFVYTSAMFGVLFWHAWCVVWFMDKIFCCKCIRERARSDPEDMAYHKRSKYMINEQPLPKEDKIFMHRLLVQIAPHRHFHISSREVSCSH